MHILKRKFEKIDQNQAFCDEESSNLFFWKL